MPQGLTRFTDFVDGDQLPESDLDGEFNEIHDALKGAINRALLLKYNVGDFPVLDIDGLTGATPQRWKVDGVEKVKINATGQLESVISSGTAPIVVASNTLVSNLNSNFVAGKTAAQLSRITLVAIRSNASITNSYAAFTRLVIPAPPAGQTYNVVSIDVTGNTEFASESLSIRVKRYNAAGTLQDTSNETVIFPMITNQSAGVDPANLGVPTDKDSFVFECKTDAATLAGIQLSFTVVLALN